MATKAQIAQSNRKPKFSTRTVRRCWRCGKGRSYLRKFELCRICFKEMADNGRLPGVRKSSW